MTNTLHRKGTPEALKEDFVVFATPTRSLSPELPAKMKRFTEIVLKHGPVNVAKLENMAMRRVDSRRMHEEMQDQLALTATFDNVEAVAAVIADLKEADLGVPINVSGLLEEIKQCCGKAGLTRHSAEQSLGVFGRTDRLPSREVVEINSMCGHGMVSFNLIKKIIDEIKLDRMTPEQGADLLAKPCECAAFNPTRARKLLETLRQKS
ncbi:MAG: hypothetical protein C4532_15405 [Candidatus Abyssobacteria bacterium SURF_17]|uniref:Uncharacterized protein n=1 Tax=Candidatus Abyssobacteria bacterium SURF_17 TaxID=2093361 RepID=A0A419ET84_9BACT|nr:MAG: hypothetical protein C4532_15405 [Candidatus Abyssubacteria bacterium SURF_17]